MTSVPRLGSLSAPPHPAPQLLLMILAPLPESFDAIPLPQPQLHPQAVVVEEAASKDLDATYEYYIEGDNTPEVASNTLVLVDATTQRSRPSLRLGSAAASPSPVVGIWISGVIEALITSAAPVYQATRRPPPFSLPLPPPLYADSAPRVHRRPPQSLLIQRPRTRSTVGNGQLFEPLLSDNRCLL